MKKLKLFLQFLFFIVFFTQNVQAQETSKKGIKDNGVKTHYHVRGCCQYRMINIGGSQNNTSANTNAFNISGINTKAFNFDFSQTLLRKPGFSIGFNIGGNFFSGNGDPFKSALPNPFLVTNQISNDVKSSGESKNSGYFAGVGPQFNFHFANRFIFSPIFQIGYMGVTQSDFKATQTTIVNGFTIPNSTLTNDLITQSQTKSNGLGMIPKARLTYMFNDKFGFWAEANYLLGPTLKNDLTIFKPEGQPNDKAEYSIGQIRAGTFTKLTNETKYNTLGFAGGFMYSFGKTTPQLTNQEDSPTILETTQVETPKVEKPKINNNKFDTDDVIFTTTLVKSDKKETENCAKIVSPSNGSTQNIDDNIKIVIDNQNIKQTNFDVKIYKISNDKNFWNKSENQKELMDTKNTVFLSSRFQKESDETGFKPLSLDTNQKSGKRETTIEKGKLTEGSYKMVVVSNCGVTTSNFKVSSAALTTMSLTTTCKEPFGNYNYTFVVKNTGTNPINITSIPAFTSSTGTISGVTILPALPLVLAAGATQNFTGSFSYSGTYTGDLYAQVNGHQVGNTNLTSTDTELGELKSCICDYCEKVLEFDNNTTPNATYNVVGNSLAIHQDWWNMNSAAGTVVAAKAEIISFVREVSDDCMKCNKDSNQWGNFISGTSGAVNGSFGNANSGVTGNTHHTLYFANPNAYSFDTNISIPPLSTLSCCCEKIRIKIRYTYTFRDSNGNCKMCSAVFEYRYQKGTCPIVGNPVENINAVNQVKQ